MTNELFKSKIVIEDALEQFIFIDYRKPNLYINITVLYHKGKAMLIDTGFVPQAEILADILKKRNIVVTDIILTHYHPDHTLGITAFNPENIYCSEYYQDNYKRCIEEWYTEMFYVKPTRVFKDQDLIKFGPHTLKVRASKSHSKDSVLIEIDGKYLAVGDLIMRDMNGVTTYPWIGIDGDIDGYLYSLEWIKQYKYLTLLLGHGLPFEDNAVALQVINEHIIYFRALKALKEKDKSEMPQFNWSFEKWHNNNIRFIQRQTK